MATRLSDRSSDPDDDAPFDLDPIERLRPLGRPTWRERIDDATESIRRSPARSLVPVGGLVVVAVVAWWLLRPPTAPPIEQALPAAAEQRPSAGVGEGPDAVDDGSSTPASADGAGSDDGEAGPTTEGDPQELVVAVAGAVVEPGVHRVPGGSRVDDALRAAGGVAADADLDRLNLAAPLVDGERIWVPRVGDGDPPEVLAGSAPPSGSAPAPDPEDGGGAGTTDAPVDLNAATATELEALPGVGPATASAIVEHRERNGPFTTVDELIEVRGIGEVKLEQIRPHAAV